MSNQSLAWIHKLKLTVISPVHIGAGKKYYLSPFADYFVDAARPEQLFYLDQERIGQALLERQEVLDQYLATVYEVAEKQESAGNLRPFLEETLELTEADFVKMNVPRYALPEESSKELQTIIRTNEQPFIPGTSLKGALNMVLIYDWLINDTDGEQQLEQIIDAIRAGERPKFFEDRLFGKPNAEHRGPDTQHICVGDSTLIDPHESLGVFGAIRVSIHGKPLEIPMTREALDVGTVAESRVSIMKSSIKHEVLQFLDAESHEALFEKVFAFSQACIEHELSELSKAPDPVHLYIKPQIDFYQHLKETNRPEAPYIRLGGGKTYYDQAIGIAIKSYQNFTEAESPDQIFQEFRKIEVETANRRKKRSMKRMLRPEQELFPATRTITPYFSDKDPYNQFPFLPFGWIKLENITN